MGQALRAVTPPTTVARETLSDLVALRDVLPTLGPEAGNDVLKQIIRRIRLDGATVCVEPHEALAPLLG